MTSYVLSLRERLPKWEALGLKPGSRAWKLLVEGAEVRLDGELDGLSGNTDGYSLTEEQQEFWVQEEKRLLGLGVLQRQEPCNLSCVSPAFFVPKRSVETPWRLVVDQRGLNSVTKKEECFFSKLVPFLRKGQHYRMGLVIDVSDAFYSVGVKEESQQYMRVAVGQGESARHYSYRALPMGWTNSPSSLMSLYSVLSKYLTREVGPCMVYLDDFLALLKDERDAEKVRQTFLELGLRIKEQSYQIGEQVVYLGHQLDFARKLVRLTEERREGLIGKTRALDRMARTHRRRVDFGALQSLVGSLEFAVISLPVLRLDLASVYDCMKSESLRLRRGRPPQTVLTSAALSSLRRIIERLSLVDEDFERSFASPKSPPLVLWTDASDSGWGVIIEGEAGKPDEVVAGTFVREDRELHINLKELLAVREGILLLAGRYPRGFRQVTIFTDSTVVLHQVRGWKARGSANQILSEVFALCARKAWQVTTLWVPSADNRADEPSRDPHKSTFTFDPGVRRWIEAQVGQKSKLEVFASGANALTPVFCSRFLERGSGGNAWVQNWRVLGERYGVLWLNPPFCWLGLVVRKLTRERPENFFLVVPEWATELVERELTPTKRWTFAGSRPLYLDLALRMLKPPGWTTTVFFFGEIGSRELEDTSLSQRP